MRELDYHRRKLWPLPHLLFKLIKAERWDKIGEIVKIRFRELTKLAELIGRHRDVDAFVAQKIEGKLEMEVKFKEIEARLRTTRERLAKADRSESGGESRR